MVTAKIQELKSLQARAAKLAAAIEIERTAELATLGVAIYLLSARSLSTA